MPSFDVVSQVDMQEVRNAVDQTSREIVNRYDFKGTATKVSLSDDGIALESSADGRLEAAIDVVQGKLVKRKVSLKAITGGDIKPAAGGRVQTLFTLNQGISQDAAKELAKTILPIAASPAAVPIMFASATPRLKKRSGKAGRLSSG